MRKKTIEDYVELVYDLQIGKERVHTNDIASALEVNPASVTEIFHKLSDEGYIDYEKYGGVTLTDKGRKIAKDTKRRHDALKEFLTLIGVNEEIAGKDACEMEHILHRSTMDAVIKFVETIKNCQITPFWLERLREYIKTGKLSECPPELVEICRKYSKNAK